MRNPIRLARPAIALFAALLAFMALTPATAASPRAATNATVRLAAVDCGTDLSCFATQAESCGPSSVLYSLDLDLAPLIGLPEGFISSVTDALQVEPDPNGSAGCQLGLVVEHTSASLSDTAVQALLDRGASQADIDQMQAGMAASTSTQQGRSGTCLFAAEDLAAMLQRWNEGSISTSDWAPATCSGSYFGG